MNIKSLSKFEKEWCTFDKGKKEEASSKYLNVLHMHKDFSFASNFEHWNFANNEAYLKNISTKFETIMLPLWYFNDYKTKI